ncbi:MAG: hypothetical protein ACK5Q5_01530 [Planctomycetaceae bacterium]
MSRALLTICRFCLSAWIGAAALFVINGIRLVTDPAFDTIIRNRQALLRFPPYYLTGFVLVTLGLLTLLVSRRSPSLSGWRWLLSVVLVTAALLVMTADYLWVYLPMEAMVNPPDQPRPAEFVSYHEWSTRLNVLHIGLAFIGAILVSIPGRAESARMISAESDSARGQA